MRDTLKRLWMRWALRGVRYSDAHGRLDEAYRVPDPWRLAGPAEAARFAATNRILLAGLGRPETLLEVGCGEGHHSERLAGACGRLTGIDVSARAVARAKARLSGAEFLAADLFSSELDRRAPFDAAAACEVLYYMKDPGAAVARLSGLARGVLVTVFEGEWTRLAPVLDAVPRARSEVFSAEGTRWKAWWWRRG